MTLTIKQCVEKELKRGPCSTMDAIFLGILREDYEDGDWDTNRMDVVKEKYGIS